MGAILATLLGGLLAIAGGLVGIALGDRRERMRWLRDAQWQASANLLSSLQHLLHSMMKVAYLDQKESHDESSPTMDAFGEAAVQWNNARYGALLIVPPEAAGEIPKLDREVDRLFDLARERQLTGAEFRVQRVGIGQMAAEYLRLARRLAGSQARLSAGH